MQRTHIIQLCILAVSIMLVAWAISRDDPYGGAGADGAIGEAAMALIAIVIAVILLIVDVLWVVIGCIWGSAQ